MKFIFSLFSGTLIGFKYLGGFTKLRACLSTQMKQIAICIGEKGKSTKCQSYCFEKVYVQVWVQLYRRKWVSKKEQLIRELCYLLITPCFYRQKWDAWWRVLQKNTKRCCKTYNAWPTSRSATPLVCTELTITLNTNLWLPWPASGGKTILLRWWVFAPRGVFQWKKNIEGKGETPWTNQ